MAAQLIDTDDQHAGNHQRSVPARPTMYRSVSYKYRIEGTDGPAYVWIKDFGAAYYEDDRENAITTISGEPPLEETPLLSPNPKQGTYATIPNVESSSPAVRQQCTFCWQQQIVFAVLRACCSIGLYLGCIHVLLATMVALMALFFVVIDALPALTALLPSAVLVLGGLVSLLYTMMTAVWYLDTNLRRAIWLGFLETEKTLVITGLWVLVMELCFVVVDKAFGWSLMGQWIV